MTSSTIELLLKQRGAGLKKVCGNEADVKQRAVLSRMIADNYMRFEKLRDMIVCLLAGTTRQEQDRIYEYPEMAHLLGHMGKSGLIRKDDFGGVRVIALEELVWDRLVKAMRELLN